MGKEELRIEHGGMKRKREGIKEKVKEDERRVRWGGENRGRHFPLGTEPSFHYPLKYRTAVYQ